VRILVADDHPIVRRGVCSLLESRSDLQVCAEAEDGQQAVDKCLELKPDLIILDITMPRLDGFSSARKIRAHQPSAKILILSMHAGTQLSGLALSAGAHGFISKSEVGAVLLAAVDTILAGGTFFQEVHQNV
jgi:DNA-binding NarL/FixJ family response regulator